MSNPELKNPADNPTPALIGSLERLLRCTELNLDDLEEETREVIEEALELVGRCKK